MRRAHYHGLWICAGLVWGSCALCVAVADEPAITYDDHVAAILKKNCATCHGDGKQEAGLSLVTYAGVMKGAGGGEIVIAGRSGASRLVEVITAAEDGERMPPDGDRVPAEAVALIQKWIDTGLRENTGSSVAATRTLVSASPSMRWTFGSQRAATSGLASARALSARSRTRGDSW